MGSRFEVRGAVVVVTGASGGIGSALTGVFRDAGATVVTTDLPGRGADVDLDVTDLAACRAVVERVRAEHGRLDVAVANAGIGVGGLVEDIGDEDWSRSIAVNLTGTSNLVRASYPVLVDQRRGALVLMASLAGLGGTPLLAPYAMTKSAVVGLGQSLRPEAARHGIGVTVVCPGPVETPLLDERSRTPGLDVRRYLTAAAGKPIPAERLAAATLAAVRTNRAMVVPGRAGVVWRVQRWMPWLGVRVVARVVAKELRHASGR